jgi:hypothetical protein
MLVVLPVLILSFLSCQEEELLLPSINYHNLNNVTASQGKSFALDIDQDGGSEYLFTTLLAADDLGDQLQFVIYPARANQVFEIAGRVGVLEEAQQIAPGNPFDKSVKPMVIKTITNSAISWSGDWKEVNSKFIGIRFKLGDSGYYYGWIRVSFDLVTEQFIIHDFAYQTTVDTEILAGVK